MCVLTDKLYSGRIARKFSNRGQCEGEMGRWWMMKFPRIAAGGGGHALAPCRAFSSSGALVQTVVRQLKGTESKSTNLPADNLKHGVCGMVAFESGGLPSLSPGDQILLRVPAPAQACTVLNPLEGDELTTRTQALFVSEETKNLRYACQLPLNPSTSCACIHS